MKIHSTNYRNTFIAIADDSTAQSAEIPPLKADAKTVANLQFEMIINKPYQYSSDDVLFQVFATRKDISKAEYKTARAAFFSKGQPCLRASPLTKRYGWGIHHNAEGKIALVAAGTHEYAQFLADNTLTVVKAMKSSR